MLQIVQSINNTFRFSEGRRTGILEYPVTPNNLRIAMGMQGGGLVKEGEDIPLEHILCLLKDNGCVLDSSLNIRRIVREPLINVRCGYIGAMVTQHLEACQSQGWNPETTPVHLYWCQELGNHVAMKMNEKMAIVSDYDQGAINIHDGDQIALSFREWHLVPRNERVLYLRRNLQVVPTFAKSIKALCTEGRVVVDDGRLIKSGMDKLWVANLEADKVIAGGQDEPPKWHKTDNDQGGAIV